MAEEENEKEYRWESGYEKTWEAIQEDECGLIETSVAEIIQKAKRKRHQLRTGRSRLGIMRHVYLLVDCSEAMLDQDLKPTRQLCTSKLLEGFLEEFFDQNPISQLGIIALRNKRAEKITDLDGNSKKHLKGIKKMEEMVCSGEPSLQNGLELAAKSLKLLPSHASREIIVILGNLTTCDPSYIVDTITMLKNEKIRCSVIGLAAEVHICLFLTQQTGGVYSVVLDDIHYKDQLSSHVDPPTASNTLQSSLIKMGFPHQTKSNGKIKVAMCMCHLDDQESKLKGLGYACPQCGSQYCELPVECRVCALTLVSAPHLARSYHHLFPVPSFTEIESHSLTGQMYCFSCQKGFSSSDNQAYKCEACEEFFCLECDLYIHDSLRTCPGCATNQKTFHKLSEALTNK